MEKIRIYQCRICGKFVGHSKGVTDVRVNHLASFHSEDNYNIKDKAVVEGLFDLFYSANRATRKEAKD